MIYTAGGGLSLFLPHSARTWILNQSCALMRARVGYKIRFDKATHPPTHPPTRRTSQISSGTSNPPTRLLDFFQTPVLGLGLGVDFIFAGDNHKNENDNPYLNFVKRTVLGDKEQGVWIRDKG